MIAKRSLLRALVNREVKIRGEFTQTPFDITVSDFVLFNLTRGEYTEDMVVTEGDSVLIMPSAMITMVGDRVMLLKAPPLLYASGMVSLPPYLDHSDGEVAPIIRFEAHKDTDLATLPYALKLYVCE